MLAAMPPLPERISRFLLAHHVIGLALITDDGPWAASCFYAVDVSAARLLLLTSLSTRHGQAMQADQRVAGTISGQPENWRDIRGIQLSGRAHHLQGDAASQAMDLYCQRHPLARLGSHPIWSLEIDCIKYTSNRLVFGQKTLWQREAG